MSPPSVDRVIEEKGLVLLLPIWSENNEFGKIDSKKWNEFTDWMKRRKLLPENFDGKISLKILKMDLELLKSLDWSQINEV